MEAPPRQHLPGTGYPPDAAGTNIAFRPQQTREPSSLMPQEFCVPQSTWTKEPAGGEAEPRKLLPQQAIEPSSRRAQVWRSPALMDVNVPSCGGSPRVSPQQAIEPSSRTAHVWKPPALTDMKEPSGGEACPYSSLPQQAMV